MSKLITAKVLSERKYGDKDKVKIVIPSRCSPDAYDNEGIDPTTNEDFTQDAVVACNNNLAKDDLVWISYLDEAETQAVIVSPYWGKTSSDNFESDNPGEDPSDPTTDILDCGCTLADLAVVIVTYGEHSGPKYGRKISKLNKDIKKMITPELYSAVSGADGKSIGIRQWTGSSGRAKPVYKAIYNATNKKQGSGSLSDNNSTIAKVISSSSGRDAQWEIAKTGKLNGKGVGTEPGQSFADYIKQAVKGGIKDNACLLYYCDMCNQTPARGKKMIAGYKKGMSFKDFYQKVCLPIDSAANIPCPARRKAVYQNIKMMQDAGWLKGKAGNLDNVFNGTDNSNETTGWVYPINDTDGKFKIDQKWRYKDGIRLAHKNGKSEGKKAVSMYKGTVKEVNTIGSSYSVIIKMNTKTNDKYYVEYHSLDSHSVNKGDKISKNTEIGKLKSNGLLLKVHSKNGDKKSSYINPTNLIGTNSFGSGAGGFGGNPGKFTWYYQMNGGKYFNHNYGGSIAGGKNASEACGIFSVAMIWASFSGDKKSYVPSKMTNGKGTGIAQKWGAFGRSGLFSQGGFVTATNKHKSKLRCRATGQKSGMPSLKTIKSVVGKGGVILCCAHGYYGDNFYTTGHYFVITGLTKNNKMILADPGWKGRAYYKYTDPGGVKGTNKGASVKFKHGGNGNPNYYYNIYPA